MHSALSALDSMDTQHSVPLTLQALSAECEHRVWSLLGSFSAYWGSALLRSYGAMEQCSGSPVLNCCPGPGPPAGPSATFFFEIFFRAMISLKTLSKQGRCRDEGAATAGGRSGGTDGAQRRDSGDAGVETAAARASRRV